MQMSINTNRSNKPFGTEFRLVRPGCFHLIIFLFAFSPLAQAQIGGANPSTVGETEKYVYYSSPVYSTFQWENAGGTPVNFGYDNVNFYYWVDISWQATGEHYLMFIGDGNIISQTTITVVACTPPAAPPQPTYSTNVCGPKTLYFNGAPGTGVTWYWQGENANGTSMANSSSSTEVSLPGTHTYYLRTRSANCWGGSVAVSVTVNVIPHEPWPVIREPINYTCGAKELDAEPDDGPPPTGEMWYWQGNSEFGTEINHIYTIPYQAYQSDTYYIRARSEAGCWSETSMSYTTTVNNPSRPPKPTRFTTETCGPQSIGYTASEVPPNTTWYWQISSTPTQGFGSESSMDLIESGTYSYYLRARSGSCWSPLSPQLSVLVDNPHTPWPVIREPSDYTCGVKELTAVPDDGPPPNGVSWYWQGLEEEGMNEAHDYSIPYQAYQSGNYHIRAKSDGGCWSQGSLQWPANVNNPTQPPFPEISPNNCGAKTISYNQPAGSDYVWYWQTEASGQDKTNSSSSILIEEPGYYTYFLRSNRGDCWSSASSRSFHVYISPPTPSSQMLTYCNWENIVVETDAKNANWYDSENTLQYSGEYLTLGKIYDPGTYLFKVEAVGDGNCPSPAKANIEINITDDCNEKLNWIETKTYNLNDLASHSLSFFDQKGSLLQSQTWSLTKNKILVSQPIRDRFGRLVLNTLSAPSAHTVFKYNVKFVWSPDGRPYSYIDFDQLGHLDGTLTPSPVVSGEQGSLGWYYSASNTWEDHVPVTGYPYTRSDFYDDGTGELRKSAGPGEHHRMGSGQEILSGTFPVFSELDDYVDLREKALPGVTHDEELIPQGVQAVTRDQNGRYFVNITDKSGNLIMTGRQAGDGESSDGALIISNSVTVAVDNPMIYFYLLQPFEVGISGSGSYSVENLVTGLPFTPSGEWPVGFYRVIVSSGSITVAYQNKLMDIALWFYDDAGRLKVSLSPNGYRQLVDGNGKIYEEHAPEPPSVDPAIDVTSPLIDLTSYQYNHRGWLLSMSEPDAGKTKYLYRRDGKIRFSQNTLQRTNELSANNLGKFSYTLYDNIGRPTESGEYKGTLYDFSSLSGQLEYDDQIVFSANDINDWVKTHYDYPVSGIPNLPAELSQEFLRGAVSWTENMNIQTWYSYDEMGRVTWMAQKPAALNLTFITKYKYDFFGNVLEVMNASYFSGTLRAPFYHHYEYDDDNRLTKVFTSVDGVTTKLRANYEYYLHGPLKRIELGENIQGIDFVYNIHGWLTQINHPDGGLADPGRDGESGDHSSFRKDVFGMVLDYYESNLPGLLQTSSANHNNIHKLPFADQQSIAAHSPLMRISNDDIPFQEFSAQNTRYREMIEQLRQKKSK